MDVNDEPTGRAPLRRLVRAAGSLAGIGALAGCGGQVGENDDATTATDDPTSVETATATPSEPPAATTTPETTTPGSGRTPADQECQTPTAEVRNELERVRTELTTVQHEHRVARFRLAFLRAGRSLQPGGFDDATVDTAAMVGERVAESVVKLPETVPSDGPFFTPGGATGWFRRPNEVVTNAHVADRLPVTFTGTLRDGTTIDLETVAVSSGPYNEPMDLALLRTDHEGTPLPVGDAGRLESGQPLVLVGHPTHFGDWTVSLGRYTYSGAELADAGIDGDEADERGLPSPRPSGFTAVVPAQGGNSGSPVVTLDGRVVGTIWFGWQSVPGAMETTSDEPFVYDQPIAPRAHSSNHHTIGAIDDWLDEHR
jgi:S1-C subfamily serine protease